MKLRAKGILKLGSANTDAAETASFREMKAVFAYPLMNLL